MVTDGQTRADGDHEDDFAADRRGEIERETFEAGPGAYRWRDPASRSCDDLFAGDPFAADILARCRLARQRHGGRPSRAWSTGEQLAVALVLRDRQHLAVMDYTVNEAAQRVYGGMTNPPSAADFNAWLDRIRTALTQEVDR